LPGANPSALIDPDNSIVVIKGGHGQGGGHGWGHRGGRGHHYGWGPRSSRSSLWLVARSPPRLALKSITGSRLGWRLHRFMTQGRFQPGKICTTTLGVTLRAVDRLPPA
jgi:hypothetical protein